MKINVSIEARMTSSRLPGKVLKELNGLASLEVMVSRVKKSKLIDDVIVATTTNDTDEPIVNWCKENSVKYFRGSEDNVYERVLSTHEFLNSDIIVELSGDCPLLDPKVLDKGIQTFLDNQYEYVATSWNYPLGMAVEIFTLDTLKSISLNRELSYEDKEHVTPYLYTSDKYSFFYFEPNEDEVFDGLSVTLDTKEDYEVINNVCKHFGTFDFSLKQIVELANSNPNLVSKNKDIHRKGLA